jgi:hypothetical protein
MLLRACFTHTEPKLPLPRNRTTLNFLLSSLPGCDAAPGLAGAAAACIAGAGTPRLRGCCARCRPCSAKRMPVCRERMPMRPEVPDDPRLDTEHVSLLFQGCGMVAIVSWVLMSVLSPRCGVGCSNRSCASSGSDNMPIIASNWVVKYLRDRQILTIQDVSRDNGSGMVFRDLELGPAMYYATHHSCMCLPDAVFWNHQTTASSIGSNGATCRAGRMSSRSSIQLAR